MLGGRRSRNRAGESKVGADGAASASTCSGGSGSLRIDACRGRNMPAFSRPIASRSAQILDVVEVDAGEDRAVGIEDIDRIERPPRPDFEDDEIELRRREQPGDGQQW